MEAPSHHPGAPPVRAGSQPPRQGIDAFLDGKPYGRYGFAFDRAESYLRDVHMRMSREVGWLSDARPFDFEGISGYYPVTGNGRCEIRHGDEPVVRFSSGPDGRLDARVFGPEFDRLGPDATPWRVLAAVMNGALCLEPSNLELARDETHGGREVVYGVRYGDACAFGISGDDANLRTRLAEMDVNVRFASVEALRDSIGRWNDGQSEPGFEPAVIPRMIMYVYDGRDVRDEAATASALGFSTERERDLIAELRGEGDSLRYELERAAGIPEGARHFRFPQAVFPSLGLRDDALFLMTGCNRQTGSFLSAYGGEVTLFKGRFHVDRGMARPVRAYGSVLDAVRELRAAVLSKENLRKASLDWNGYRQRVTVNADLGKPGGGPKV